MKRRVFNKTILNSIAFAGLSASPLSTLCSIPALTKTMKKKRKKLIKPPRLKKGDTIGLIAPGSPVPDHRFEKAVQNIEKLGFKTFYTANARAKHGFLAGTDSQRLDDLHYMFAKPEIAGIWCLRGGYGCTRLLPSIDYRLIKKHPKALIGYSDVTALLQAIHVKTGLVGFHGPAAVSKFTDYTVQQLRSVLIEPTRGHVIKVAAENLKKEDAAYHPFAIREGRAEGRLTGGNLSLLASMIGTKYEWSVKDKIVFIEDIGEKPYRIDRMLTQLLQSSRLDKAAAIILGVFVDCEAKPGDQSLSLSETLKDRLYGLNIPVIYGLSFGHIANQCTLPVGAKASIDTSSQELTLLEAPAS